MLANNSYRDLHTASKILRRETCGGEMQSEAEEDAYKRRHIEIHVHFNIYKKWGFRTPKGALTYTVLLN